MHVNVIQLSKKEMKIKSKPWITPAIQISISKKNKLYKNYLKTKSVHYYTRFKIYRNKINHLLRISKRNYYMDEKNEFASNLPCANMLQI